MFCGIRFTGGDITVFNYGTVIYPIVRLVEEAVGVGVARAAARWRARGPRGARGPGWGSAARAAAERRGPRRGPRRPTGPSPRPRSGAG